MIQKIPLLSDFVSQASRSPIPELGEASGKGAKKAVRHVGVEAGSGMASGRDPSLDELLADLRACRDRPGGAELQALMDRLRGIARRHLPSASRLRRGLDSEDLAQEGVLQLLANLDQFRGDSIAEFVAFAASVIGQQAAKQARWQGVRRPELGGQDDAATHATDSRTPSTDAISEERRVRILELVDGLAEPYRAPLRMRLAGMNNAAIAEELGLREDLVRKRLSRALKDLHGRW